MHYQRQKGFDDLWTCSYVRIRGGALTASYKPTFKPFAGAYNGKNSTCLNTNPAIGKPDGRLRFVPPKMGVPGEFSNGRTPPSITLEDIKKGSQ